MVNVTQTCGSEASAALFPGNLWVLPLEGEHASKRPWFEFTESPGELLMIDVMSSFYTLFDNPYVDVTIVDGTDSRYASNALFVQPASRAPNGEYMAITSSGEAIPLTVPSKRVRLTIPYRGYLPVGNGLTFNLGLTGRNSLLLNLHVVVGASQAVILPRSCDWSFSGLSDTERVIGAARP